MKNYLFSFLFMLLALSFQLHAANGTACPSLLATRTLSQCAMSSTISYVSALDAFMNRYVNKFDYACSLNSSTASSDYYLCYAASTSGGTQQYYGPANCTYTYSCPATYTVSGDQCVATVDTVCGPVPDCIEYSLSESVSSFCSDSPSCMLNGVEQSGLLACPAPKNCPVEYPHTHNVTPYLCAPDNPRDCSAEDPNTHNASDYVCAPNPPRDCSAEDPNTHNASDYVCAPNPPRDCSAEDPNTYNVSDYVCAPNPDSPPTDPPPDDGSGNPPPDGSGSGSGSGDGTGDGTGSTGDGTGSTGSGTPTTCGSLACESTMLAMSGKIGDVLAAINTTRSIELAGILDTSKKMDTKTAVIAAIAQQALEYVMDLIVKETTQIAQNSDLLAKTDSLVNEIRGISNKQDLFSDKFSQKMDAMTNKIDDLTGKQTETNTKLDDLSTKASQSLDKQDITNTKLDGIKDELGTSNTKLEGIKDGVGQGNTKLGDISAKLDNLSWLEKLGNLDALGDWFLGVIDAIKDAADVCTNHPDWLICPAGDLPEITPTTLPTQDLPVNPQSLASAAGECPPDYTFTLHGQSYSFTFRYFCDLALAIRMIVIAIAYLIAARILSDSMVR